MKPFRGTIAYRSGLGGCLFEGFGASFIGAWNALSIERPGPYYFMRGLSCMLHDSANQVAQRFKGDWFLMCDTDHVFGTDALLEMVETFEENNLDILSGFMQSRQPPYGPVMYRTNFDPYTESQPIYFKKEEEFDLHRVDAGGCGSLMVHRRVIDRILECGERPFDMRSKFLAPNLIPSAYPSGVWRNLLASPYSGNLKPGYHRDDIFWEDFSFFWRAKILGFKAYVAPWIKFFHVEKRLVSDNLMENDPQKRAKMERSVLLKMEHL